MMICTCDGCSKQAEAIFNGREWLKPAKWLEKGIPPHPHWVAYGIKTAIHACSVECIEQAEANVIERARELYAREVEMRAKTP